MPRTGTDFDIVCLSHLRWDFVYQRPNHLLHRAARARRVYFVEEPVWGEGRPRMEMREVEPRLFVATPHLPAGATEDEQVSMQRVLLDQLLASRGVRRFVLWYYTPMARAFTSHIRPLATVYDCMDELSAFRSAPQSMRQWERELFGVADVVFTGGQSLFEVKRKQHPSVHAFPSSVDVSHFAQARNGLAEPEEQAPIAGPRIGYVGVIDERIDLDLLAGIAAARPAWQIVMVGPTAKVDPAQLPQASNIHYLGGRPYEKLPSYMAGWDAAIMPFALNDATRYISPTKTPEYLAAGLPVVSTPIADVVVPYGQKRLVRIAADVVAFVASLEEALASGHPAPLAEIDAHLAATSWDRTWSRMLHLIEGAVEMRMSESARGVAAVRARVSPGVAAG